MNIIVNVGDLRAAVAGVLPAIDNSPTIPVLSSLVIDARDDGVMLRGTNLVVGVERTVAAQIVEAGVVLVPARLFADVLGSLPQDAPVTIDETDGKVRVKTARNTTNLAGRNEEDYPEMPQGTQLLATISGAALLRLVHAVGYAMAVDNTRPVLHAILISAKASQLTAAAADGFRMAVHREQGEATDFEMLLHADAVAPLTRLCQPQDTVTIKTNNLQRHMVLSSDNWRLVVSVVDGRYPDFTRIIPTQSSVTATVEDHKNLMRAVSLVMLTANQYLARIDFNLNQLVILGNGDTGNSITAIDAQTTGAVVKNVGLNARLIRDVLSVVNGPVAIKATSPQSPVCIVPAADADRLLGEASSLHIIMPMAVRS